MTVDIRAMNFELTDAIRDHALKRLDAVLTRFGDRVSAVAVRLGDVNGTRGGIDKRCHLEAALPGAAAVVVEHTDKDLYEAINQATGRLKRALGRQVGRDRSARLTRRVSASGLPT